MHDSRQANVLMGHGLKQDAQCALCVFRIVVYWRETCLERIALLDKGGLYKVVA